MKVIELDLTGCKYFSEMHERIQKTFDFPEWYGKNWDAFWDLLWSDCDADKVIILGENILPAEFKGQLEVLHKILNRNILHREKYQLDPFSYEIVS